MNRKVLFALVVLILTSLVSAPCASAATALSGWVPSKDCSLSMRDGQFVVTSSGHDPYLVASDFAGSGDCVGPFTADILMSSNSKGLAQIYWTLKDDKRGFGGGGRVATFTVLHDNEWHLYSQKLDAPSLGGLRFDPSTAAGEIRIASISIKDSKEKVIREWKLGAGGPPKDFPNANGNAQIRGKFKNSEIVITTTQRLAGAIHSLTWNGKEFIDSVDHGRQLQSASNFDAGSKLTGETYNPTEAGARSDGVGTFSTSRLLSISAEGNELKTKIQMAFWLQPGEKSGENLAKNTTALSEHPVAKRVKIGHKDLPNVIEYDVTFTIPNEHHTVGVMEALTGYMPGYFKKFYTRNPQDGGLQELSYGPGEQTAPVVLATEDGGHAMGIFAPDQQPGGVMKPSYGRFRFGDDKVMKWNCVFRLHDKQGIKPGDYAYKMFVVVGTVEDVKSGLNTLVQEFK